MPFEFPVRIYWEDTDAGGSVFYANTLNFFHGARPDWRGARGIEQQKLREATGGIFVVSETTLKYLRPARLDDELVVTAQLAESGRASITLVQQARAKMERTPEGQALIHCEGTIRIGWVDAATMRPARMPAPILEALK